MKGGAATFYPAIEKFTFIFELVAQSANPVKVMYAKQIVRFVKPCTFSLNTCTNIPFQTAFHQHSLPAMQM
ncbi:hypothetical protein BIY28_18510 [Brenneria goodwinii]|nr:hypothetical protein BIY28_18510 [Brenneria goodwinii]